MGFSNVVNFVSDVADRNLLKVPGRFRSTKVEGTGDYKKPSELWIESIEWDSHFDYEHLNRRLQNLSWYHQWEGLLLPWVRRIEQVVFGRLAHKIKFSMDYRSLGRWYDDKVLDSTSDWPSTYVTGSNISAINAGKAAWALLRFTESEREEFWNAYQYYRYRTEKYIERAFSRGYPFEGPLYALFGLKAVAVLAEIEHRAGMVHPPISTAKSRLLAFVYYLRDICVGYKDFLMQGDSKMVDFDGAFLSHLFYSRDFRPAGEMLGAIGPKNARTEYYTTLYNDGEEKPLPGLEHLGQEIEIIHDEGGYYLHRDDDLLVYVEGNHGFGDKKLHLDGKAGDYAIHTSRGWEERPRTYTNAINNVARYDRSWFNAPDDTTLLDEYDREQLIDRVNQVHP